VGCELEVGGGVRTRDALHEVLALGVDFAIVGTILARAPEEVATWAEQEAGRIIASIDARDGKVQVSGWREGTDVSAGTLARYAGEIGLAAVEYTNIARDGMLQGPDIEGTLAVARETDIPVILSGGVSSTEDAEHVRRLSGDALAGIIVGRALYEGTFNLEAAIARTA
jgi:phosphoribosylformimino-5-aminoimidazole carboxamide ribotide isomerase